MDGQLKAPTENQSAELSEAALNAAAYERKKNEIKMAETKKAIDVTMGLELASKFQNIAPPYDEMGLGFNHMGWLLPWPNQDVLASKFIVNHGEAKLKELMPKHGDFYIALINDHENTNVSLSEFYKKGKFTREQQVEFQKFWLSPEMKEIQIQHANSFYGDFALSMTSKFCLTHGVDFNSIVYQYFFDCAVHTHGAIGASFDYVKEFNFSEIKEWFFGIKKEFYPKEDFKDLLRNMDRWEAMWSKTTKWQRVLMTSTFLSVQYSMAPNALSILNRRGTIAFQNGVVGNKDFFEVSGQKPAEIKVDEKAVKPKDIAELLPMMLHKIGRAPQYALRMLDYWAEKHPGRGYPRYWALCDFNTHSAQPRFFILDTATNQIEGFLCSHGKGSEGKHDDGIAEVFSNIVGSKCSSLGIFECAETYYGKHGYSLRIDGKEKTNSNARVRAVVIHPSEYVSEDIIRKTGRLGRSEGCFMFNPDVSKKVIDKLKGGSVLLAVGPSNA